jgi:hypothetical protein
MRFLKMIKVHHMVGISLSGLIQFYSFLITIPQKLNFLVVCFGCKSQPPLMLPARSELFWKADIILNDFDIKFIEISPAVLKFYTDFLSKVKKFPFFEKFTNA